MTARYPLVLNGTSIQEVQSSDSTIIPPSSEIKGGYIETIYALGTSGSIALNPANGSIQTCAASANITFTDSVSAGQSIVLMLTGGTSYTITWPTTTWVSSAGNSAPTLTASSALVFWKVGTTLYGAMIGSYA